MKNLNNLIDTAYDVFSGYQPQETIDACTVCCMTQEEAVIMTNTPVAQIPKSVLAKYQDAARPEKLDIGELKYLAPRYLELIKSYQFPSFEPVLSLTRFSSLKLSDWTSNEKALLQDFALSFFHQFLQSNNPTDEATAMDILLMFHKGNFDINPLLNCWNGPGSKARSQHLMYFNAEIKIDHKGNCKVQNHFADSAFSKVICNWLNARN